MKKAQNPINLKGLLVPFMAATLIFTGCSDDDSTTTNNDNTATISEEDAAEAILMTASPDSGGLVLETQEALYILESSPEETNKASEKTTEIEYECGEEYSSSYSLNKENGAYTYNTAYAWEWTVSCTSLNIPADFYFDLTGSTTYTSPRISGSDTFLSQIAVTGINLAADTYAVSQSYTRTGTQTSSVRNQTSFESSISFTTENLAVTKETYKIVSGDLLISFTGKASTGTNVTYSGVLTFNGNQSATLTMGSGTTYELNW